MEECDLYILGVRVTMTYGKISSKIKLQSITDRNKDYLRIIKYRHSRSMDNLMVNTQHLRRSE